MFTPILITDYARRLLARRDENRRLLQWAAQRHADADSTPPLWQKLMTPEAAAPIRPAIPDACAK